MGLRAKWTIICDQCGLMVEVERRPEDDGITTSYFDEWGPGIPNGWIQIPHDETTNRNYLFFHESACYEMWLHSQGREEELKNFRDSAWIA